MASHGGPLGECQLLNLPILKLKLPTCEPRERMIKACSSQNMGLNQPKMENNRTQNENVSFIITITKPE